MTDLHLIQRGCRDKRRYGSEEEANRVAAIAYEQRGHWLRAYQCDECLGGWHLSHKAAMPPEGKNWRPPAKSMRQLAREKNRMRDRRRRR